MGKAWAEASGVAAADSPDPALSAAVAGGSYAGLSTAQFRESELCDRAPGPASCLPHFTAWYGQARHLLVLGFLISK